MKKLLTTFSFLVHLCFTAFVFVSDSKSSVMRQNHRWKSGKVDDFKIIYKYEGEDAEQTGDQKAAGKFNIQAAELNKFLKSSSKQQMTGKK